MINKYFKRIYKPITIFTMSIVVINMSFLGVFFVAEDAGATHEPMVTICHVDGSGAQHTMIIPESALNGHFDASGNPLHYGDHMGECVSIPEICDDGIDNDFDGDVDLDDDDCFVPCDDSDDDGICDDEDNCPEIQNQDQTDIDQDGWGLACDCNDDNPDSWRVDYFFYDADDDTYYKDGPNRRDDGKMAICYGEDIPEGYTTKSEGEDCDDTDPEKTTDCSEESVIFVKAYKVVCNTEAALPNWGLSGTQTNEPSGVTDTTASDFVASSDGRCFLEYDWDFEWGLDGVAQKQSGDFVEKAGASKGWNDFDSSSQGMTPAEVEIDVSETGKLWFREFLKEGYVPFADAQNPESAEFYCGNDIMNFDNYDYLNTYEAGSTYYCVAFNALKEIVIEPVCGDNEVNQESEECDGSDDPCGNGYTCIQCSCEPVPVEVCEEGSVTLLNPSFEEPKLTKSWDLFSNPFVGWMIEKVSGGDGQIELQGTVKPSWVASDGSQYVELDSTAPTVISQTVATYPEAVYTLSYDYSPRPGIEDNLLNVLIDDVQVQSQSEDGSANKGTQWITYTYSFVASDGDVKISFADGSKADSLGTFIDNIKLELSSCIQFCGDGVVDQSWEECDTGADSESCTACQVEDGCSDIVLARVNLTSDNSDGTNSASNNDDHIYLGGVDGELPSGAWFPVFQNGSYINDSSIEEDVKGLAVQRKNGEIKTVLYRGTKNDPRYSVGNIEFYNASILDEDLREDSSNVLEGDWRDGSGMNTYNVGDDELRVVDGKAMFWLGVTTGDDGFYVPWTIVEDCDDPVYSDHCGDGIVNQEWEECDGEDNGSNYKCTEQCQFDDDECSDLVAARVNVSDVKNGNEGNMSSDVFLGASDNVIPQGVWFALFYNGSAYTDSDVSGYEDVPGLAVERADGSVRAVLYGTRKGSTNDIIEHIDGNIEFFNASVDGLIDDKSSDMPGSNRLENDDDPDETGNDAYANDASFKGTYEFNAAKDEVWMENADENHSYFYLTTTTADDGYFTTWSIVEDCEDEPEPKGSIKVCKHEDINGDGEKDYITAPTVTLLDKIKNFVVKTANAIYLNTSHALPDWSITVTGEGYDKTQVTSYDGCTVFENLTFGDYMVSEENRDHWRQTYPNNSGGTIEVQIDIDNKNENVYFLNEEADLWGCKYSYNGTGEIEESTTLGGWDVNITTCYEADGYRELSSTYDFLVCDGDPVETTTTRESDGCYDVYGLENGTYKVSEVMKDGWEQTYPGEELYHTVMIPQQEGQNYNFGNKTLPVYQPICGDGIVNQTSEDCDGQDGAQTGYTCDGCVLKKNSSGGGDPGYKGGGAFSLTTGDSSEKVLVLGEEGAPVLTIEKSTSKSVVNPGEEIEFEITVTNTGNLTAFNVILTDVLPEGFRYIESEGQTKDWILGDMAAGESKVSTVKVNALSETEKGTYSSPASAEATNHDKVSDSVDVSVELVQVLAATGFSMIEFASLLFLSLAMIGSGRVLRRKMTV